MKKSVFLLIYFYLPFIVTAQPSKGSLAITIKDFETGFRVSAEASFSKHQLKQLVVVDAEKIHADQNGFLLFTSALGEYDIKVETDLYKVHNTHFTIENNQILEVEILLDKKYPASISNLDFGLKAIFEGYITNKTNGQPLKNVQIRFSDGQSVLSDNSGYYRYETLEFSEFSKSNMVIKETNISFSKEGFDTYIIKNSLVLADKIRINIELKSGNSHDEIDYKHKLLLPNSDVAIHFQSENIHNVNELEPTESLLACTPPSIIRVASCPDPATNSCACSCTCTSVTSMSLESYVASGIDDEWINSWASNSLKAGTVAYRTYGAWWVQNPFSSNYDIKNTACNQRWVATAYTASQNAAAATSGELLQQNNAIPKAEYSAENNNAGCGNGYSGTGSAWPCISDNLCAGQAMSGHGRGMCQWGSKRWADQGQSYTWILDHYYNPGGVSRCGVAILPPGNDNCPGTPLTSSTSCSYTTGQTVINATASGKSKPSCDLYSGTASMLDVWYSFSAVSTSHSINVQPSASTTAGGIDAVVSVYNSCSATSPISGGCKDDSGTGSVTNFTVTGLTVGATYYIRVYDYGASIPTNGGFSICVTHTAQSCTTTLSPTSQSVSASSTSTTFNISLNPIVCVWSVSSNPCNLQLNPSSGGGGNVTVTYSANTTTTEKRCSIVINGQTFTLIQAAASCNYSISSTSQSFASAGGNGSFSLTTSTGCTWSASTNCNWVTVTNSSGSGSSVISYTVSANTSTSSRTCAITVNGQIYTVTQSGVSQACTYSFSPLGNTYTFEEQIGRLNVIVNSGCDWIATSNSSWIDVLTPNGSGNGEVSFKISKNTRANEQTGTVKISGRSPNSTYEGYFNVIQTGMPVCNYSINSSSQNFASTGGSGSFNLSTTTDCAWAASTDCNWVTLNSNSGSGTSTINYTVSTNTLTTVRTCIITINGKIHTITQQGSNPSCTAPTNLVVSNITQTSATVTWANGQNITDLQVGIKPTNSTVYNAYPMASTSVTTFTIPQLICGTNYDVRVLSNCSTGSPVSIITSFTTLACSQTCDLIVPIITIGNCVLRVEDQTNCTYQWQRNGVDILNANTRFLSVTSSGFYTCVVKKLNDLTCSKASKDFYVTYGNPCVDSKEIPELKKLVVYPNPNKGTFIIEFELQEMKDMGIKIYNAIGQQVYNRSRSKFIGKFKEQIDLRHLSAGIYLVTIEINDKKVVKNIVIE